LTALAVLEPYVGATFVALPPRDDGAETDNSLETIASHSRIRFRSVQLKNKWWRRDGGPLLGYRGDERRPVALFRTHGLLGLFGRYELFDPVEKRQIRVNKRAAQSLASDAISFVRPLPANQTNSSYLLLRFAINQVWREGVLVLLIAMLTGLLGMLHPVASRLLIDFAIPDANLELLSQIGVGLLALAVGISSLAFSQGMLSTRLRILATASLQTALFDRLLRLPQRFFSRFSSGDLANRSMMVIKISSELNDAALDAILTGLLSLLNLFLCYYYAPQLVWIALAVAFFTAVVAVGFSIPIRRLALSFERLSSAQEGLSVQLINGISKLRVSGAELRAFNYWSRRYTKQLQLRDGMQRLTNGSLLINSAIDTISLTLLFYYASQSLAHTASPIAVGATTALTMGTFLAFYSAFGTFVHGAVGVTNKIIEIMDSWAKRELIAPLFEAKLENDEQSVNPGRLKGHIVLENVKFRYHPDRPLVLNDLSMEFHPGEFAAIVGPSGSGKSTLFKLLLGFDTPESGKIYFDNQDLASLDKSAIRSQLGSVLQSARIGAGSIFDAIAAHAQVTLDQAWEAACDAGLEADLKSMPMGMHTVLDDGATTLSGGQRQRILIARALVRNPKILIFDEATSALDLRTQEIVNRSLERRRVTRIVIAHRLSTIQNAQQIFVLENGCLRQSGNYDQLIRQEGLFRRLASRQMA
jgi:NHLM bacteriocin system ABC transporter ATP-binding protein